MNVIDTIDNSALKQGLPDFSPGDTVKVHVKIVDADTERIPVFQGVVVSRRRRGLRTTFTVRKISEGMGVERIFPLHSPVIDKIDVVRMGKVRRSKLYYLRDLKGKAARIRERREA
jgi:large subunit ribosomal protein L19